MSGAFSRHWSGCTVRRGGQVARGAGGGLGQRLVMVGGAVAHPAATPEPDVRPFDRLRTCFRLIRLLSPFAVVSGTVCRGSFGLAQDVPGHGSDRAAAPSGNTGCCGGSRPGDALRARRRPGSGVRTADACRFVVAAEASRVWAALGGGPIRDR